MNVRLYSILNSLFAFHVLYRWYFYEVETIYYKQYGPGRAQHKKVGEVCGRYISYYYLV